MIVVYQQNITRQDLIMNPDIKYVFGDNCKRTGTGGQAKVMRGEPNAVGIITKKLPTYGEDAYLRDSDLDWWLPQFETDIRQILTHNVIVFPAAGIGTGLARLPETSPLIFRTLNEALAQLGIRNG